MEQKEILPDQYDIGGSVVSAMCACVQSVVRVYAVRGGKQYTGFGRFHCKQCDTAFRLLCLFDILCQQIWLGICAVSGGNKYREWDAYAGLAERIFKIFASGHDIVCIYKGYCREIFRLRKN